MIGNDWDTVLSSEFKKEYFTDLMDKVKSEYTEKTIYPNFCNIFNALKLTPYKKIKVIILGQDPYHGIGEAHGLCFSVQEGIKIPPSLKNIYKELYNDLNIPVSKTGSLNNWAKQGVLLLNAIFTVEKDKPASHQKLGWEQFTNAIIVEINKKSTPVIFVLWGNFAKSKKELITNPIHKIIENPHPSPFSANKGFFGSKPFSKINKFLKENNIKEIEWEIKKEE